MRDAWRDAASQSWTAARIRPRSTGGSPAPLMPGDQQHDAVARRRSPAPARGRSPPTPGRGCGREGRACGRADMLPERSRRSQLPSSVAACNELRRGGGRQPAAAAERVPWRLGDRARQLGAAWRSAAPVRPGSRDSGRMVAATLAHSAASSAESLRTRRRALGQQDQRLARWPTCRRRSPRPRRPRPRRCRSGWRP